MWWFWSSLGSGMPSVYSVGRSGHKPANSKGRECRRSTLSLKPCFKTTMPSELGICLAVAAFTLACFLSSHCTPAGYSLPRQAPLGCLCLPVHFYSLYCVFAGMGQPFICPLGKRCHLAEFAAGTPGRSLTGKHRSRHL